MAMADAQDIIATKNKIIQTAFDLAAIHSWNDITLNDIAIAAELDCMKVTALFPCKSDIITAYARIVDNRLIKEMDNTFGGSESRHDKLFDIMMARYDILNENRAALISIINGLTLNPKQGMETLPALCNTITTILNIAGENSDDWRGAIKISALSIIYLKSLREWINDDTADMASTMAGLDKSLAYFDKIKI